MSNNIKTVEEFYTKAEKSIGIFDAFILKHSLSDKVQPDHICYKCDSKESFEYMRHLFESNSEYIFQSIISHRRIAVIKFKEGIQTSAGEINFLELSDQKPDNSQREGFDHIEAYAVGWTYDDMVKDFESKETVIKVERAHHTTHDIDIGDGFLFRCTQEPLIQKIKNSEMV
jgi:predicted metalloenzyme YecM